MRRLCWTLLFALMWCGTFVQNSRADSFVYTFELPNFTVGQNTPILNAAPNVGAGTFTTSFLDGGVGYAIATFQANSLITGQALVSPVQETSPLTLLFNTPISELSLDWGINGPVGSPLQLTSGATIISVASVAIGGGANFPGGFTSFSFASPVTTVTLQGLLTTGGPTQIEIDNLTLTTTVIPEPSTLALLGVGLSLLAGRLYLKKHTM